MTLVPFFTFCLFYLTLYDLQRQARFYVPLHAYVRGAQAFMKALGVTTILLLTDSQAVIEESLACKKDFPELCGDISWRYVEKKRWYGAEGGWEVSERNGEREEIMESEYMKISFTSSFLPRLRPRLLLQRL